jgi:predicted nucleotidyltransferase
MTELINQRWPELEALCRKYRVKTLEIFGFASDGSFDPQRSDLDFLVNFLPLEEGQSAPDYFGLLHSLEDLFERKIDLVLERAIRNPYFLQGVNKSRRVVYAA